MTDDKKLRDELLAFDGIGRNILEQRIIQLVRVLDAASELVAADDAATDATSTEEMDADERYERAWEELRSVLKAV